MAKNAGKIFEESIKKSLPDYVALIRLNDSPQVFTKSKLTRFTPKTPFDYIVFDTISRTLYCWELKSTKSRSMSFENIYTDEEEDKMIHKHQILGLRQYSQYPNIKAGFFFNFRHNEDDKDRYFETTYYQSIEDFLCMIGKINKKSFDEINLVQNNAIKIQGAKKKTRWYWDINSFIELQSNDKEK